MHELEERIANTRAETPQGMLARARIVVTDTAAPATVDDLEQTLEERLGAAHLIGLSLILDILHVNGLRFDWPTGSRVLTPTDGESQIIWCAASDDDRAQPLSVAA